MRASTPASALLVVLLGASALVAVHGGKFSKYTTCGSCVAAGFGWSVARGKCGGYPNRICAEEPTPAQAKPAETPPQAATRVATKIKVEDTVHIMQAYCNEGYAEGAWPMLRSLMFHRSSKVHFHLVADRAAKPEVKKVYNRLKKSFKGVEYSFVKKMDKWLKKADKLQKTLNFPTQLPPCSLVRIWASDMLPGVDAAIAMDPNDLIILGDVAELWSFFSEFKPNQMIGSVREQTRHYNRFVTQGGQGYDPKWKGVMDDYGFNCGVLMMNLTRLRDFKWLKKPEALAKKAVKKGLMYFGFLAENDIWNYAVMQYPHMIHKFPCAWDIILYGGGWGLWGKHINTRNHNGATCTPIKILHGTGGSFKKHELGRFHRFFKNTPLKVGEGFIERPIPMTPTKYYATLPTERDPHRAAHADRLSTKRAPSEAEEVHLVLDVCAGVERVGAFLKSTLLHRSTALHLVMLGEIKQHKALKRLMKKFQPLTDVRAEYVKVERGTCKQPQPARGVSLRSTMLTLASLPPRVIFVNCELAFVLDDVARLWAHFEHFSAQQSLGASLKPKQGSMWVGDTVVLMDLAKLRTKNNAANAVALTTIGMPSKVVPTALMPLPCNWDAAPDEEHCMPYLLLRPESEQAQAGAAPRWGAGFGDTAEGGAGAPQAYYDFYAELPPSFVQYHFERKELSHVRVNRGGNTLEPLKGDSYAASRMHTGIDGDEEDDGDIGNDYDDELNDEL